MRVVDSITIEEKLDNICSISIETLAYLAGILDGEGCIMISRRNKMRHYYLRITCNMVDKEAIELLHETFGGAYKSRKTNVEGKSNLIFYWDLFGGSGL